LTGWHADEDGRVRYVSSSTSRSRRFRERLVLRTRESTDNVGASWRGLSRMSADLRDELRRLETFTSIGRCWSIPSGPRARRSSKRSIIQIYRGGAASLLLRRSSAERPITIRPPRIRRRSRSA
jgi:hypothetical protein